MDDQLVVVAEPEDIGKEAQYKTLNDIRFIRGETSLHQWYLLVTQACSEAKLPVDETVRDYLAVMLERFMKNSELFSHLTAFGFGQHILGVAPIDAPCTQDVADISLQYVAFFPERSTYRHEMRSVEYVANMGESLYRELAKLSAGKTDWYSRAFPKMTDSFGRAVMVLRSTWAKCPEVTGSRDTLPERIWGKEAMFLPTPAQSVQLHKDLYGARLMYFQSEGQQGSRNN